MLILLTGIAIAFLAVITLGVLYKAVNNLTHLKSLYFMFTNLKSLATLIKSYSYFDKKSLEDKVNNEWLVVKYPL